MKIKIFYSWQTSTSTKYNKNFIQDSIEKAIRKLKKIPETKDIEYVLQEGISNEPGSPPVAGKITDERIPNCDIFIADLSVTNKMPSPVVWILKKFKLPYRPSQNTNVILEYGVALDAIKYERLIGVLNKAYGSPKDNPDNIPFDIKHLRFPIEFNYSSKHKKTDIQENFVNDLRTAIKDITVYALNHYKQKYHPLLVWDSWEAIIPQTQRYISNEKINEIGKVIKTAVSTNRIVIRLLGLSGLGKTRILFELFRPIADNTQSAMLTARLLYFDCNLDPSYPIVAKIEEVVNSGDEHFIILDNCPASLCRKLQPMVKSKTSKISLITIDNNPEEAETNLISDVSYYVIKKEDMFSVVEEIVSEDFKDLSRESIEKIKEFAQGIPMMAVLLGDSAKRGEKFIGRLDDKFLLDSLLGDFAKDPETKTLLKSSSLFNYFGYKDELLPQLTFIATNKDITITNSNPDVIVDKFHLVVNHYLSREIFEPKGRLITIRPFPLAMYLAQEWLMTCTPDRMINMIVAIAQLEEPHRKQLSEALAEQMKYLGWDDKAIEIVERITGNGSPFDNAEVLNTELGSRLFRAFVEVNPVAIANNLYRNFLERATVNPINIKTGRRNLVWVLEKLCFDCNTFEKGIKVLYAFAVAENETWTNNATGQFLHLFKIMLAGTEAPLQERIKIIEWGLAKDDSRFHDLALLAMERGLSFGHFTRMGGSELQGTKVLQDNVPTSQEIEQYWTYILNKLLDFVKTESVLSEKASSILLGSLRGIVRAGYTQLILPILTKIALHKNEDWDEALVPLKQTLRYEEKILTEEKIEQFKSLLSKLTKNDFFSRYKRMLQQQQMDVLEIVPHEKITKLIEALGHEFVTADVDWKKAIPMFFSKNQYYAFYFGKGIYDQLKSDKERIQSFIDLSVDTLLSIPKEQRDESVLGGIFAEGDKEIRDYIFSKVAKHDDLIYILFYLISLSKTGYEETEVLFQLVDRGKAPVSDFVVFSRYGYSGTDIHVIISFCQRLFEYGTDGYMVAYKILSSFVFFEPDKKSLALPILKECIVELGIIKQRNQLDEYQWWELVRTILKDQDDSQFAALVNHAVIESITWENMYHLDHDMERTYELLLNEYFDVVWPEIAANLLGNEEHYIKFYGLKHILGSSIGRRRRGNGVIVTGDIDIMFQWADQNAPLAPKRLAQLIPVFGNKTEDGHPTWHPIAKRLIDNFGNYEDVLSELSANLGTFSWTGSVVPYYEMQIELMEQIKDHPIPLVSDWAIQKINYLLEDIKRETIRDQEMRLR
ncbi:MAG: hypothetical protein Q8S11_08115 [Daejeonella sp.]|uniref:hypothetical protein n=1 Tax=Daejeonella sp. TaxID=2805397 RepID=UPI00273243CE|nr:hypothetical protein [Daejeonella sp.]MDP3468284.1 hypothetical protein [Daejeonella sp.]